SFARVGDDERHGRRARRGRLPRSVEPRSVPAEAAARSVYRRRRARSLGVRDLSAHLPVLTAETLGYLQPERGGLLVDCTVGIGGHARAIRERGASRLVGFDRDPAALGIARTALAGFSDRVELVHADYRSMASVLDARGIHAIDGALADLGVSS